MTTLTYSGGIFPSLSPSIYMKEEIPSPITKFSESLTAQGFSLYSQEMKAYL